jgi:hypothetical protein
MVNPTKSDIDRRKQRAGSRKIVVPFETNCSEGFFTRKLKRAS